MTMMIIVWFLCDDEDYNDNDNDHGNDDHDVDDVGYVRSMAYQEGSNKNVIGMMNMFVRTSSQYN